MQLSIYIYEQKYKRIKFLKNQSTTFISWICPLLKPTFFQDKQYVYFEGDDINQVSFLTKGQAGFVLPKYENAIYIKIKEGDHFGIIDIMGSCHSKGIDLNDWMNHKAILERQFTVMAITEIEVLFLSI